MLNAIENEISSDQPWIERVVVKGLHKRIDFDVRLQPGINVIYGKNGLGKTTLLHIIANISEIDIERFKNLNFEDIQIVNNNGESIELRKDSQRLYLYVNGELTSYDNERNELSELERRSIRGIIGQRSTYLPAFRSVLERMREGYYASYEQKEKAEFRTLIEMETRALNEGRPYRRSRGLSDLAENNVLKTMRCRQWFGDFVPIVRYPSITDVSAGLSDEWNGAQIAISRMEQKQFETAFVQIFTAIAQGDEGADELNESDLLATIRELIAQKDSPVIGPGEESTYSKLVDVAENRKLRDRNYNNLLQIYVDILNDRKINRENVLSPLNEFKKSVNNFLTEKRINITSRSQPSPRSSVQIEPDAGKPYGLTQLSSGERQIVTMLYSASRSSFQSACCLIDEPELSLHVDWQRTILGHIQKQHVGLQIIACTHSPEVGADHEASVQFFKPTLSNSSSDDVDIDSEEV